MFKKILIVLVVVIAGFLVVVAMQPAEFLVAREATIAAPQPVVFGQVNDLRKWEAWSPWAKLDPAVKNTFEGPPSGKGAIFAWAGNDKVGEGKMTITESQPYELVRLQLDFIKPFASTATNEFTFKNAGDQTAVRWTMAGKNNFIGKMFCMFMNMDKMVGGDFEKGLASIKTVAEAEAKSPAAAQPPALPKAPAPAPGKN